MFIRVHLKDTKVPVDIEVGYDQTADTAAAIIKDVCIGTHGDHETTITGHRTGSSRYLTWVCIPGRSIRYAELLGIETT